jgi:hypothetical protein
MKQQRCPTCHRLMKRSSEANRLYWLLLHMIADKLDVKGTFYTADQWHMYFKTRFIGADDITMPNGKVIVMPKSSADLDTSEFNDYLTQVQAFAGEHNVYLEDIAV